MRGGRKDTPSRVATREVCQGEWVWVDRCAEGKRRQEQGKEGSMHCCSGRAQWLHPLVGPVAYVR
eukprot:15187942-Ditylum_brightwellii.AAC.1